jgi:glutamate synthase domain-containing protein 2
MGRDVVSPSHHIECKDAKTTVEFIKRVQDVSQLPVGMKLCLGDESEFTDLVKEMKLQNVFPDYVALDGSQGGTGAAPKSFMDDVGVPLFPALRSVQNILVKGGVRDKMKIVASGKLINPGKQIIALALGADVVYTARGFMLALGCIQALQCNKNTCPVGITTQNPGLQKGLDIEEKAERVKNYAVNLEKEFKEILSATGSKSYKDLNEKKLYIPEIEALAMCE